MAYDLQLVQINTNLGGLNRANTAWGLPVDTDFHTLLMSYWMCGPWHAGPGTPGSPGIWLSTTDFIDFTGVSSPSIILTNQSRPSTTPIFSGDFPNPLPTAPLGCLLHFLVSVDTHAQIVQVYVNDQPVTVTGTWAGTPPYDFNVNDGSNVWQWNVSGVVSTGIHPALGDAWITNPPAFVDLSVVTNRRKFISSTYTPVDLGDTGTAPFGYQPALYMSVRPGGVPADILLNRGVGGGTWNVNGGTPPSFQTDGVCLAIPPPPPRPPAGLALDDVMVRTIPTPPCQIFLSWSDDRGHSYGSPVGQPMGSLGEYRTFCQWARLGYARDRIFKLEWSCPRPTALQGGWVELTAAKT